MGLSGGSEPGSSPSSVAMFSHTAHFYLHTQETCSHVRDFYAVDALPTFEGGHSSKDIRPPLVGTVKKLLIELGRKPMLNVDASEFKAALDRVVQADEAVAAAVASRQQAFADFTAMIRFYKTPLVASYLDDLVVTFYE